MRRSIPKNAGSGMFFWGAYVIVYWIASVEKAGLNAAMRVDASVLVAGH